MNVLIMPSWYLDINDEKSLRGIFHYEQAVTLAKYCKVAVYYPFDDGLKKRNSVNTERGILTYRSRYELRKKLRNRIDLFWTFLKIRKEFKPDIIHAHVAVQSGKFAVLLGNLFRIPVVLTEHTAVENAFTCMVNNYSAKYAYKHSQFNACVSDTLKRQLLEVVPECDFNVIYNGINSSKNLSTVKNNYKDGFINVAFVALLYSPDIKGLQFLIPAIKELVDEKIKIVLHIIGGGEYKEYFEKIAIDEGVADFCFFYGMRTKEQMNEIVAEMDFFVSSSLIESFGCAVAEAMMLGKPVVVTNSGGSESFVTEETGIIVEKGSVNALVNGLKFMINNYEGYNSEYIKEYAHNNFDIDKINKDYIEIYKNLLSQGKEHKKNAGNGRKRPL